MENRCLIVSPPAEPSTYPPGHFKRVYDYVIIPACRLAGFWPEKLNDPGSQPLDVVKGLVDCPVVICDISAGYADAAYVLAVRQALHLPVVLIKDLKSVAPFDVGEFHSLEYDESLRIDTVQKATEELSEALKKAVEHKEERYALLDRLGLGLPKPDASAAVVDTTYMDSPAQEKPQETHLPIISPLPDYVGEAFSQEQLLKLKTDDELFHLHHGRGKVNFVKKMGKDIVANIQFGTGTKLLVLEASDFFRKISS